MSTGIIKTTTYAPFEKMEEHGVWIKVTQMEYDRIQRRRAKVANHPTVHLEPERQPMTIEQRDEADAVYAIIAKDYRIPK